MADVSRRVLLVVQAHEESQEGVVRWRSRMIIRGDYFWWP
jgi:hypothetical protein